MEKQTISSPKQNRRPLGRERWYPYYAGFSSDFARSALKTYSPIIGKPVLDQWNGAGTTTNVCRELGLHAVGCDINPVMLVIAKAMRLQSSVKESISPLASQLLKAKKNFKNDLCVKDDPLSAWIMPSSVVSIRSIEHSIRKHFIPNTSVASFIDTVCTNKFSDLAAYFYLILFRSVRHLLSNFKTANPTWIRVPSLKQRIRPSDGDVVTAFASAVNDTLAMAKNECENSFSDEKLSELLLCDSRKLPMADNSIGAILTSPPYLTRLDYAVSTRPELAILGQTKTQVRELRAKMIGTTTVKGHKSTNTEFTGYAGWCLQQICGHESKASKSYYFKNILQYLDGIKASIDESARVLTNDAPMSIVVQDSYYKDVHLDLPRIVKEFGESNGLILAEMHPFPVERHLALVHPHHRKHTQKLSRVETVVVMRKRIQNAY